MADHPGGFAREKYGEFAEEIVRLGSDNESEAEQAVQSLVTAGDRALPALANAVNAKKIAQRVNLVRVLAGIGGPEARAILKRIAEQDRNADVRSIARDVLTATGVSMSDGDSAAEATGADSEFDAVFDRVRKAALAKLEGCGDLVNPMVRLKKMFEGFRGDSMGGDAR